MTPPDSLSVPVTEDFPDKLTEAVSEALDTLESAPDAVAEALPDAIRKGGLYALRKGLSLRDTHRRSLGRMFQTHFQIVSRTL